MSSTIASTDEDLRTHTRFARHITSVLVCNLTPFPKRDSVTSSLSRPSQATIQALEGTSGLDDADLTLSQRRSRKLSSTSVSTLKNLWQTDDRHQPPVLDTFLRPTGTSETPRKTRRVSRGSLTALHTSTIQPILSPSLSPTSYRPRPRSLSQASHFSFPPSTTKPLGSPTDTPSLQSYIHSSLTQRSLEKVIDSRLIETFVTMALPVGAEPPNMPVQQLVLSNPQNVVVKELARKSEKTSVSPKFGGRASLSGRTRVDIRHSAEKTSARPAVGSAQIARSRPSNASHSSSSSNHSISLPSATPPTSRPISPITPVHTALDLTPFYVSHIHRPSTNPSWVGIDAEREFSAWTPVHVAKFQISLWGSSNSADPWSRNGSQTNTLKGKERALDDLMSDATWRPLLTWDIDLDDGHLVSPEMQANTHLLPPNTLLLRLAPSNELFYFHAPSPSRPSTPPGHASDGEVDTRTNTIKKLKSHPQPSTEDESREVLNKSLKETRMKISSGWQDLVRLVTLESVLSDTRITLEQVLHSANELLACNSIPKLQREASELELAIKTLNAHLVTVKYSCNKAHSDLQDRKLALQARRQALQAVQSLHSQDKESIHILQRKVADARIQSKQLASSLDHQRNRVIQALESVFPIEPFSTGELLFSILDIPLPLPVGATDPAPPLSLPSQPSINEETIATALGSVAQVVHLLAVYLNYILPYPITCAASRSMIRDPISTMQGPRVFPLFSKGVETYRFEYAVFLLNKDIEMLMSERNLRAMDMRHTLPNLKNLLLTLTSGSLIETKDEHNTVELAADIPECIAPATPLPLSPTTSHDARLPPTPSEEHMLPIATPRRQFLSPLTAMLRSKYTSTLFPSAVQEETSDSPPPNQASSPDPDDHPSSVNHDIDDNRSITSKSTMKPRGDRDPGHARDETLTADDGDDHGPIEDDSRSEQGIQLATSGEDKEVAVSKKTSAYGFGTAWSSLWLREKEKDPRGNADPKSSPDPPPPPLQQPIN